jgi:serine protease inhibitor
MTYIGAAAETQQAMARALEFQGMGLDAINQGNARLRQALSTPDPQIKLNLANSLWLQQGLVFKTEFLKRNEEFYGAALQVLNLNDSQAPVTINAWVAQETAGKITRIVEEVSPTLLLVNVLYFKGAWTKPFDKVMTRELPFNLPNGKQKLVPLMDQWNNYRYFRGKNFQAISLPYGDKEKISMKIFLPDQNSSLKEFLRELNADNWQQWQANFQPSRGSILLPRFKLEYTTNLAEPLTALGMGVAFDEQQADFTNLCPRSGAYISQVLHKTFAEVNEEGTEAAAVTVVEMREGGFDATKNFTMVVDRPFFVAIEDSETGALLFMGAIFEPK